MPKQQEAFVDTTSGHTPVRGFLHATEAPNADSLVLTHGAGGNCNTPLLGAIAHDLAAAGTTVLRCDLPFRQRKSKGPPSPSDAKADQEGLKRAVMLMKERSSGRVFLGGSSYGGRQASLLVSSDPSLVSGLLLLSYPLHPPGRPEQMRTTHFPSLHVPSLFVSGTRDAFGSIEELQGAIILIPARTKLVSIEGAGHGLLQKSNRDALLQAIVEQFQLFFG